jgi:hypothetical protein
MRASSSTWIHGVGEGAPRESERARSSAGLLHSAHCPAARGLIEGNKNKRLLCPSVLAWPEGAWIEARAGIGAREGVLWPRGGGEVNELVRDVSHHLEGPGFFLLTCDSGAVSGKPQSSAVVHICLHYTLALHYYLCVVSNSLSNHE